MDKLHYYVCQTDKLLAKYVKIAEVDSVHILELDKTMDNMRFMAKMNDQYTYTNESDNVEDGKDDVDDIDPGDKLVNYFTVTKMMMMMMKKKKMMITIGTAVMMTMHMVMPIKEGDSLLQAVYQEVIIAGKHFNFRIVSMYNLIYCN
jgi:hypothetical protein